MRKAVLLLFFIVFLIGCIPPDRDTQQDNVLTGEAASGVNEGGECTGSGPNIKPAIQYGIDACSTNGNVVKCVPRGTKAKDIHDINTNKKTTFKGVWMILERCENGCRRKGDYWAECKPCTLGNRRCRDRSTPQICVKGKTIFGEEIQYWEGLRSERCGDGYVCDIEQETGCKCNKWFGECKEDNAKIKVKSCDFGKLQKSNKPTSFCKANLWYMCVENMWVTHECPKGLKCCNTKAGPACQDRCPKP